MEGQRRQRRRIERRIRDERRRSDALQRRQRADIKEEVSKVTITTALTTIINTTTRAEAKKGGGGNQWGYGNSQNKGGGYQQKGSWYGGGWAGKSMPTMGLDSTIPNVLPPYLGAQGEGEQYGWALDNVTHYDDGQHAWNPNFGGYADALEVKYRRENATSEAFHFKQNGHQQFICSIKLRLPWIARGGNRGTRA